MFVQIILLLLTAAKVHVTTQDEDDGREQMDYQKQDNWWSLGRKLSQIDECSKEPRDCVDGCYYSRIGRGCGPDESVQMIGGLGSSEAVADDYPFMLSLRRPRENSDLSIIPDCYTHFCGAVLIWKDIALTAAHCLLDDSDKRTVIKLDDKPFPRFHSKITASRFSQCRHQKGQDEEYAIEAIVHPEYEQFNKTYNNDIAIIKLFGSMSTEYGFINLWTSQNDVNIEAQILGFGATGFERDITQESTPLKVATVKSIKSSLCQDLFQDIYDEPWSAEKINETTMLCSQAYDAVTCKGDSGGPLFFKQSDGKDYLLGIISWGSPKSCQVINVGQPPSVLARISFYKDWIVQTVNQLTRYPPYQIPQDNQGISSSSTTVPSLPPPESGTLLKELTSFNDLQEFLGLGQIGTLPKEISVLTNLDIMDFNNDGITGHKGAGHKGIKELVIQKRLLVDVLEGNKSENINCLKGQTQEVDMDTGAEFEGDGGKEMEKKMMFEKLGQLYQDNCPSKQQNKPPNF